MDGPLSLGEALRTWCDRALTSEFIRMEKHGPYEYVVLNPGEAPVRIQKLDDFVRIRRKLEAEAHGYLREGVWVAEAFDRHVPVDEPRKTVLADRWQVLKPTFDAGTASGGGTEVFGIVVWKRTGGGTPGASHAGPMLEVDKRSMRVALKGRDLELSPRSFKLMLVLAEAALVGTAPVSKRDLQKRVLDSNTALKAPNDVVYRLRLEMNRIRSLRPFSKGLIKNHRSTGYSLELPASRIRIVG